MTYEAEVDSAFGSGADMLANSSSSEASFSEVILAVTRKVVFMLQRISGCSSIEQEERAG